MRKVKWSQSNLLQQFQPYGGLDVLYQQDIQKNTFMRILNVQEVEYKFTQDAPSEVYLIPGSYASKKDFYSANEQRATFFYINTAPRFRLFSEGNWNEVEADSRSLASDKIVNLKVITGSYGPIEVSGEELYMLDVKSGDVPAQENLPVPKIFCKIVTDPMAKAGVVLIGVNDPHIREDVFKTEIEHSKSGNYGKFVICKDVSDRIGYMTWSQFDASQGYSYACEVNDFLRTVKYPEDEVKKDGDIKYLLFKNNWSFSFIIGWKSHN